MTSKRLLGSAIMSIAASAFAGAAQADAIAGWDFSQYFGSSLLSIDGATFTDTLDANYSDFDPTWNAGAESADFGTMYMDGTNGSDQVPGLGSGGETFVPIGGNLVNNPNPFLGGTGNPFNSYTILQEEGQLFASDVAMIASGPINVVFEADISSVGEASNWVLDLSGAVAMGGSASTVGVEYSTDGSSYSSAGSMDLTDVDSLFTVPLGLGTSAQQFVRLSFSPGASGSPVIDNLSISADVTAVPEPGTALLALTGVLGLGLYGRRRPA